LLDSLLQEMTLSTPILSLVSDKEDSNNLAGLFSKSVRKALPEYDYASVPDRVKANKDKEGEMEEDMEEEDIPDNPVKESKEIQKHDRRAQVKHEDSKPRQINPETEARTVFVGNLPSSMKKKTLKQLFSKVGTVETVRFRGAARPDLKTTKKVAVITNKFHDERHNINGYVRMSTVEEAEAACELNNTQVEGLTIRVDMALKGKNHDNKKAVFLGNLDFKTEEEDVRKLFSKCGEVENVRLVRDNTTGIGKGFGYVNFATEQSVELALRLNNHEVCGRKVRVSRANRKIRHKKVETGSGQGKVVKGAWQGSSARGYTGKSKSGYNPKDSKKMNRSQAYKKIKKEEGKSFQGLSSNTAQKPKRSFNKTIQKNKIMAKKLAG